MKSQKGMGIAPSEFLTETEQLLSMTLEQAIRHKSKDEMANTDPDEIHSRLKNITLMDAIRIIRNCKIERNVSSDFFMRAASHLAVAELSHLGSLREINDCESEIVKLSGLVKGTHDVSAQVGEIVSPFRARFYVDGQVHFFMRSRVKSRFLNVTRGSGLHLYELTNLAYSMAVLKTSNRNVCGAVETLREQVAEYTAYLEERAIIMRAYRDIMALRGEKQGGYGFDKQTKKNTQIH